MTDLVQPITSLGSDPTVWAGATWVGQISESQLVGLHLNLVGSKGFRRARLLVWTHDQPRGFVEVPVVDGAADIAIVHAEVAKLPQIPPRVTRWYLPPISVAVCTRDRPEHLRNVLESLTLLDYPQFELLVIDNNPASGLTPPVVNSFASLSVRLIATVDQGLSVARNVAIQNAKHDIVAFTDDDVVVDERWLSNLAYGFVRDARVACVCGMVPSAELVTAAQSYFDRRVGWARRCDPAVYHLADPPADDPLFPMRVAEYGTGANFAVRRDALRELGGFDEGMGIGSPTGGGEDIDIFVRALLAGHMLVREPSAVVWHRHRQTAAELEVQVINYGLGLGAWISKMLTRPRTFAMMARRIRPGIRHLRAVTVVDQQDTVSTDPGLDGLDRRELRSVFRGPRALLRARMSGRKGTPLRSRSMKLASNSIAAGRLSLASVALGLIGSLGAIQSLPTVVLAIVIAVFVLAGPGSLVLSWYTSLPASVLVPLVPALGIAICLLVVTGLLMAGLYSPVSILLGLTVATVAGGLLRCGYLARREAVRAS